MVPDTNKRDYILPNKAYDVLKRIVQIALPAFATLYFTLAQIWGLPAAEQVVGTSAALATFFGALLGFSDRSYNNSEAKYDGEVVVEDRVDGLLYSLNLSPEVDINNLAKRSELTFKVGDPE